MMEPALQSDILPFRLYPRLYFVGSSRVSVHLIETEEGLVLIDTGYPDMADQILASIRSLGFDPKKICAIFHSHGHIDHFGSTLLFKELSGAKTYISRIDNDVVNGKNDLSWANELGMERLPFFDCDVLVDDGDVFTFGSVSIRCVLSPGHTDGVMSFFISLPGDDKNPPIVAAMHGGVGRNTLAASYLEKAGLSFDRRDRYRETLHKLAPEKVDLVIGNHPNQSHTLDKRAKIMAGESIVDPAEWQLRLKGWERAFDRMLEEEAAEIAGTKEAKA